MSPCETVPVLPVMLEPPWLSTLVIERKSSLSVAEAVTPPPVTVAVLDSAIGLTLVPVTLPVIVYTCVAPEARLEIVPVSTPPESDSPG